MTVDHQLVSDGPYHPVYTAMIAVAVGTTLVFRSYLLLGVAALSIVTHLWWAAAEEKLQFPRWPRRRLPQLSIPNRPGPPPGEAGSTTNRIIVKTP